MIKRFCILSWFLICFLLFNVKVQAESATSILNSKVGKTVSKRKSAPDIMNAIPSNGDALFFVSGNKLTQYIQLSIANSNNKDFDLAVWSKENLGLNLNVEMINSIQEIAFILEKDEAGVKSPMAGVQTSAMVHDFKPWVAFSMQNPEKTKVLLNDLIPDFNDSLLLNDTGAGTCEVSIAGKGKLYIGMHGSTVALSPVGLNAINRFMDARMRSKSAAMRDEWVRSFKELPPWAGDPLIMASGNVFAKNSQMHKSIESFHCSLSFDETKLSVDGMIYIEEKADGFLAQLLRALPENWKSMKVAPREVLGWIGIQIPSYFRGEKSLPVKGTAAGALMAVGLDYNTDVKPWLGSEVGLCVTPSRTEDEESASRPELVLIVESLDEKRMANALGKMESAIATYGMLFTPTLHKGNTIKTLTRKNLPGGYTINYAVKEKNLIVSTSLEILSEVLENMYKEDSTFKISALPESKMESGTLGIFIDFENLIPLIQGFLDEMGQNKGVVAEKVDDNLLEFCLNLSGGNNASFSLGFKTKPPVNQE